MKIAETKPASPVSEKIERDTEAAEMVAAAQRGDRQAFERLVVMFQREVYNFAYRFFGDREEALELTQDVFIRVYRKLEQFRGEAKFSTWLYRVTVNCCKNRWSSKRTRETKLVTFPSFSEENETAELVERLPSATPNPEQLLLRKEVAQQIRAAVSTLPAAQRSLILLCDFEGKSYEEIAAIMECTISYVKTNIHRGRLKLRERLHNVMAGGEV